MIVEIPFIMRFTGHTPNLSAIRQIAAWDVHRMEIADLSPSDFHEGCDLGDGMGTLLRDGGHWAYWGTSEPGVLDNRPVDGFGRERAMRTLSNMIDTTRFFDEGRSTLLINRLMSTPPDQRYIETSERDRNVERLSSWISENVAMIGPHLAVRVGEPSMRMHTSAPDDRGRCQLLITREKPTPLLANYNAGIHMSIEDREEIVALARECVTSNPLTDKMLVVASDRVRAEMTTQFSPAEDMHERTLRSLVSSVVAQSRRGKGGKALLPNFERLRTLSDIPVGEATTAELDAMMDDLVSAARNVDPSVSVLIGIAASRWEDRPISGVDMELSRRGIAP